MQEWWGRGVRVEGAVTAGATCDRGLTGKHCVQTPASNLLVINQMGEMPHKEAARFTARGHFSRKNNTPTCTPVSIRLKGAPPMLHLSLPIANSVDPFLLRAKLSLFLCTPASNIAGEEMSVCQR